MTPEQRAQMCQAMVATSAQLARLLQRMQKLAHSKRYHSDGMVDGHPDWGTSDLDPPSPLLEGMHHMALSGGIADVLAVVTYPTDGLVFPCVIKRPKSRQPEGGLLARDVDFARPWDPDAITKDFRRVAKAAGFTELRLHDLRHTHATLLLMAGVPVHEVAQRLGHSTPVITMTTYSHVIQRSSDHAAQVWEKLTAAN